MNPSQKPGRVRRTRYPCRTYDFKFQIKMKTSNKKLKSYTVTRKQFPITAAYAFTDYRSQGQTLPYVIVDIAKPLMKMGSKKRTRRPY